MGLITLAPTALRDLSGQPAPFGRWTITVEHTGAPLTVNLYVQRDDVAFGRRGRGRQSRLEMRFTAASITRVRRNWRTSRAVTCAVEGR